MNAFLVASVCLFGLLFNTDEAKKDVWRKKKIEREYKKSWRRRIKVKEKETTASEQTSKDETAAQPEKGREKKRKKEEKDDRADWI